VTAPLAVTAEDIAEHLRWLLSNHNAELDLSDGTFVELGTNADRAGVTVTLGVDSWDPDSGRRGFHLFRFAVTAAPDGDVEAAAR
jgi:hypothetical protein